jgi:hypothetical protein
VRLKREELERAIYGWPMLGVAGLAIFASGL